MGHDVRISFTDSSFVKCHVGGKAQLIKASNFHFYNHYVQIYFKGNITTILILYIF